MQSTAKAILEVRGLRTSVASAEGPRIVVDGVSFSLGEGETLCIAGESGSGKSITALSVMGLLPDSAKVTGGEAWLGGRDLFKLTERQMLAVRGREIAMIFQEPMTSLNPIMSIGAQLSEAISTHGAFAGAGARAEARRMLDAVRISEPMRRMHQYPHELSGGMRQRVMIAMALSCNPKVLIADEPTTALDVTIQAQILALMDDLKRDFGTAIILITHDMGVVAEMADRVTVMKSGRIVEENDVHALFNHPAETYTRELLAAVPRLGAMAGKVGTQRGGAVDQSGRPVASVRDLTVRFGIRGGILQRTVRRVHAVEKVSFDLYSGETLAIVGESGCGKSTTGKALLNLIPFEGMIEIDGVPIAGLSARKMVPVRRKIQMVFQDPFASLDPRMTVGDLVGEPLVIHRLASGGELDDRVEMLFRRVGLLPDHRDRHPHEFSGGQRQRICIARALSLNPKIIIADESVSALDVSVQAQVLDLLAELQAEFGLSYLFISHDMAVVEQVSHRVAVMYQGQIVEIGPRAAIFENPQHSYTRQLLEAVPIADPEMRRDRKLASGEVPSSIRALDYVPAYADLKPVGDAHYVAMEPS
ncbi:MAG: ABC transporter ATP-binding protein [Alphaproteobacteria bacterium]